MTTTANIRVGVDIGGTKITVLVVDENQQELAELTFATDLTTKESTLNSITHAIHSTLAIANIPLGSVEGIGIGLPGKIDSNNGNVKFAVNLNWNSYPARQLLEEKLGVPCYLKNDVRLAALGIHYFCYPDVQNLIYVMVGTGVSAGIILNKQLHQGSNSMAGEFGHMIVDPNGPKCKCGNQGCLETYIAGPAYTTAAMQAKEGVLVDMKQEGTVTAVSVFNAAQQNDPTAQQIINQAGAMLGRGLQNLIMAYDPDKIIIGGGVAHAETPFLQAILR